MQLDSDLCHAISTRFADAAGEGKLWKRARCNTIRSDCRAVFQNRVNRMTHVNLTAFEVSFGSTVDQLPEVISPPSDIRVTGLLCRLKTAGGLARMVDRLTSGHCASESRVASVA